MVVSTVETHEREIGIRRHRHFAVVIVDMASAIMEDDGDGTTAPPPSHARTTERTTTFTSLADSVLALSMGFLCRADQARAASASRGLSRAVVAAEAVGLSIVMPIFNALHGECGGRLLLHHGTVTCHDPLRRTTTTTKHQAH